MFLVDNQLPTALARFLTSRGVECRHVLDLDLDGASDAAIWEYANRNDCIIISKDEDFLYMANVPSAKARLIWVRIGNYSHQGACCSGGTLVAQDRSRIKGGRARYRASLI